MPKYTFSFEREVTETEGFERTIEAPSYAEAQAVAANLAEEFNHCCPDDCTAIDSSHCEIGDFDAICPPTYRDVDTVPDFVVLADGQCVLAPEEDDAELIDKAAQRAQTQ
jgi:hypothetical protein